MKDIVCDHPLFIQGKKFFNDKMYEEAIDMFSSLLQTLIQIHGETSFETARAYFEYGNALLTKVEDTAANEGILGAAADDVKATESIKKILDVSILLNFVSFL